MAVLIESQDRTASAQMQDAGRHTFVVVSSKGRRPRPAPARRVFGSRFKMQTEPAVDPVELGDEEEKNEAEPTERGTRKKKVTRPSPSEEAARLRSELARDLVHRCDQLLPLVGDVSLATHLAMLQRDLSKCYKPLRPHTSEANFLSIVALVEMALTGKKLRAFDRAYLEAVRAALDIGYRSTHVEYDAVERVRELFQTKKIDTVPRIDLLALKPEDLEDADD
jgi:hypothetical protein